MHQRLQLHSDDSPTLGNLRNNLLHERHGRHVIDQVERELRHRAFPSKIRPDMVRRMDVAPQRINPTGTIDIAADTMEPRPHSYRTPHIATADDRMPRTQTRVTVSEHPPPARIQSGFGGFPGPQALVSRLLRRMFPRFYRNVQRTLTMPRTHTFLPHDSIDVGHTTGPTTQVPYFSFKAIVGRNSVFLNLTEEQIEELGGVEYRALNTLMWVTPLVHSQSRFLFPNVISLLYL